jgi:hypothetical protein
MPVLKLVLQDVGAAEAVSCNSIDPIKLRSQVVDGVFGVFEELHDVANAPIFSDHTPRRRIQPAHVMLGIDESVPADVAAMLQIGIQVTRSKCQQTISSFFSR